MCIGVPHRTDLWQVGDAAGQNGAHNIASVVEKRKIIQEKEQTMFNRPTIKPYDIIQIINYAWGCSFSCIQSNKKAIAERGWYPFNRCLMTNPQVRFSITDQEQELKASPQSLVVLPVQTLLIIVGWSRDEPILKESFLS